MMSSVTALASGSLGRLLTSNSFCWVWRLT
jgi:hypothetical protein